MAEDERARQHSSEPGIWLPLADATRVLGITEYQAYRYVRDEKLRAREWDGGRIEVWVTDAARSDSASPQSLAVIEDRLSLVTVERLASMFNDQVAQLLRPLAKSHDRSLELARENGALTERLAAAQREVTVTAEIERDQQSLEYLRLRVQEIEAVNAELTAVLELRQSEERTESVVPSRSQPGLLGIGTLVLAVVALAFLIVVVFNIAIPRVPAWPSFQEQRSGSVNRTVVTVGRQCWPDELRGMIASCRP
jgi:hypothetical protein